MLVLAMERATTRPDNALATRATTRRIVVSSVVRQPRAMDTGRAPQRASVSAILAFMAAIAQSLALPKRLVPQMGTAMRKECAGVMIFTTPAIVVYFVPWRRHAAAMESAQPKERVIVNHPTLDLGARCFVMPTQLATDMAHAVRLVAVIVNLVITGVTAP